MDELCEILYQKEEPTTVKTGYFLKIMRALLQKKKGETLIYLLITRQAKLFTALDRLLEHPSLTEFLVSIFTILSKKGKEEEK